MASNVYAIKCPCCGRSAFEDYREKVFAKYEVPEFGFMVPFEE